ncbi:MAG: DUF6755 family protein [Chthoniobacterales bacterium]
MSNFRDAQNRAHPSKTNTLSLGIIFVLILILTMQVWLLTAGLNETLDGNTVVKWPAFGASLFLFISGLALLRYLPDPIRQRRRAEQHKKRVETPPLTNYRSQ